jgi:hypothetical protein
VRKNSDLPLHLFLRWRRRTKWMLLILVKHSTSSRSYLWIQTTHIQAQSSVHCYLQVTMTIGVDPVLNSCTSFYEIESLMPLWKSFDKTKIFLVLDIMERSSTALFWASLEEEIGCTRFKAPWKCSPKY